HERDRRDRDRKQHPSHDQPPFQARRRFFGSLKTFFLPLSTRFCTNCADAKSPRFASSIATVRSRFPVSSVARSSPFPLSVKARPPPFGLSASDRAPPATDPVKRRRLPRAAKASSRMAMRSPAGPPRETTTPADGSTVPTPPSVPVARMRPRPTVFPFF